MKQIHMSAPDIDETDVQAVSEVVRSGLLALGPRAIEFEREVAEYCGVRHAVAVSSGTAGLHLLVRALGLGPGDEVLVPSFTFVSSVNAILYEGATPIFVDIEDETYCIDPKDIERKITPRTRAIMVVDIFGHPADWNAIQQIADQHRLGIIDDSCEALGAEYDGRKIGGLGDGAVFAFYPNKQITTGEGGMVVTDREDLAIAAREMRNQGRAEMGGWLSHQRLGFNYRMSEMSAALGVSQFARLDHLLARREHVAMEYRRRFSGMDWLRTQIVKPNVHMSWFVYVVTLAEDRSRDVFMGALEDRGVASRAYFDPVHSQPFARDWVANSVDLPVTTAIAERTVALPFHPGLQADDLDYVVEAAVEAAHAARGR
jgi:perosamine synthetase